MARKPNPSTRRLKKTRGSRHAPPTNAFPKGNAEGKGNPLAGAAAKLRAAMLRAVTEEDMDAIAKALIRKAKRGQISAIKELLDRTIGKAVQPVDLGDKPITVKMYAQETPVHRV